VIADDDIARDEESWVQDAEAERRAGRARQARRLAEAGLVEAPYVLSGRVVLALACLDLGDAEAAREALEPVVSRWSPGARESLAIEPAEDAPFAVQSDPLADLAENELENAFEHAESEPVEVWTTNRVAEAALRAVENSGPEEPGADEAASPFATETVAELLERQGDPARARSIRDSLRRDPEARGRAPDQRARWVGTLEHWLDNLRRTSR
jgi:hypothetical protein